MIIKINTKSETPIYLQLRNEIVKGIGKGEFEIGESLPTVRQMAMELGVNTMTVSKAYQLLKTEGFIETDRRKGTVVCNLWDSRRSSDGEFQEKLEDELELLSAEATIRGMDQNDFIELCRKAFQGMEVAFSQESAVLIFAADYAVWIALYISKHKKKAVETGSWETGKLNADNERAWKLSDLCHNVIYFIAAVFLIFYFIFGDPMIYINNYRLRTALVKEW